MKCRRARKLIFDYMDGMISDRDRIGLERHLGECRSCETMAAGLSKSLDLLHRLPPVEPGENFNWKLRLRLAKERNASRADAGSLLRWWNTRFALSALSTFVVVVVAGVVLLRSGIGPVPGPPSSDLGFELDQMPDTTQRTHPAVNTSYATQPWTRTPGTGPIISTVKLDVPRPVGPIPILLTRGALPNGASPQTAGTALDMDSLRARLRASSRDRYRIKQLEQQIELLQTELQKCDAEKK